MLGLWVWIFMLIILGFAEMPIPLTIFVVIRLAFMVYQLKTGKI